MLEVFANASLAVILIVLAAYAADYDLTYAALLLLLAVDPLYDVYRYVSAARAPPAYAAVNVVAEALSIAVSALVLNIALRYLSLGFLWLPLALVALSSLDIAVSMGEILRAAEAAGAGGGSPFLE
ncbi:MAG: hypothetical protein ACP5ID_06575 [Conexivisphaera sp.]